MLRDLLRILLVGAFIIAVGALLSDEMTSSMLAASRQELELNEIVTRDSERLLRNIVDLTTSVRGYALSGDARYLDPYDVSDAALPLLFSDLHRAQASDVVGDRMVSRMEKLLADWQRGVSDPIVVNRARSDFPHDPAAGERVNSTAQQLLAQERIEVDRFREHQANTKRRVQEQLERQRGRARMLISSVFFVAGAFIVVATLLLSRRMGRGITRLVEVSESIANARFDVEIRDERDDLGRLAHSLRLTARHLERRTRQSSALLAAGRALSAPEAQGHMLPALHDAIREIVDLQQMMLLRIDDGRRSIVDVHPPLPPESKVPPMDEPGPIRDNGALAYAIATRRSLIVRDIQDDRWPENAAVRRLGASWYVFVPLVANGRVEAVLGASANDGDGNHYHGDQAFFDLLGQQIAGALTSARLYGELAERNLELERAGRAKSDFLALMSHELRTPLNSIIGFSQVLIDQKYGPLTERQARYQQNIYSSGRHLLQLINDLLDLSKIEAGRFTVEINRCSLGELVLDAMTTLKPLADAKQLVVRNVTPPPPVRADALRLKQVLYNVLSNAIKFTPAGGAITLGHELVDDDRTVRFAVSDTGPGISDEDQERLFLPFVQVGTAAMQGLGSGLGLLLSRQLIELMGGQLGVRSTIGQGATFYFDLPLAQPLPPRALPEPSAPPTAGATTAPLALIVDDQLSARELLQEELEALGYRTLLAEGGDEGLRLARENRPDLVTLDILMPDIDGWEVLRRLRADAKLATTPVLVISVTDESARALASGALDLLVKPLKKGGLNEVLVRHRLVQPKIRVLAVDDDVEHLDMLRLVLEPLGYALRTAETAAAGLSAALSAPADVLLLDVQLPDRSGIDVVADLRRHAALRQLPILLLTGSELSAEEQARLNGEVVAELGKGGLRPDELIRHIERAVARARRTQET